MTAPIRRGAADEDVPIVECPGPTYMRVVNRRAPADVECKTLSRYRCFLLQVHSPSKKYSQFVELGLSSDAGPWRDAYLFDFQVLNHFIALSPDEPLRTTLIFRKLLASPEGYLVFAFNTLRNFHQAQLSSSPPPPLPSEAPS